MGDPQSLGPWAVPVAGDNPGLNPPPESFGFCRGLGCDDALFMIRRLDEEISEWQSFGWQDATSAAGLMDLQKAYPTANNKLFWAILIHHGVPPDGPLINALKGFHCHSECCVKTFLVLVLLHSEALTSQ